MFSSQPVIGLERWRGHEMVVYIYLLMTRRLVDLEGGVI
jgi:hypothetical protein